MLIINSGFIQISISRFEFPEGYTAHLIATFRWTAHQIVVRNTMIQKNY